MVEVVGLNWASGAVPSETAIDQSDVPWMAVSFADSAGRPQGQALWDRRLRVLRVQVLINFLTQSCDPTSCYRNPVQRTNEIVSRPISLVRSTGFPPRHIGSQDRVRKWVGGFTLAAPVYTPVRIQLCIITANYCFCLYSCMYSFCADSYSVSVPPVLPQRHVKDPGHAKVQVAGYT